MSSETVEEDRGVWEGVHDEEPEVIYVPGAANRYDYVENVVVLDRHLRDYPLAHEHIKEHEFAHAETDGFLDFLLLEFRTDLGRHFGTSETIEEVREYIRDQNRRHDPGHLGGFAHDIGSFLRVVWNLLMGPIAALNRAVFGRFQGGDSA